MFKIIKDYTINIDKRISEVFTDSIPVNAFIDKGRCAIGGTHKEIYDQSRCSIIPVPNISIIKNKLSNLKEIDGIMPELKGVYGDISYEEVVEIMKNSHPALKIMTTPEGMRKIMRAAEQEGRLREVYRNWFLLLDESHTFISEAYRKDILAPFDYFWKFYNKSIISATPYYFSDPRIYQLEYHKIKFHEKLGKITLVNATSVVGTLDYFLKNVNQFPGNVHIFYNSVTEIIRAVRQAGLKECNIFCADDKDKNNLKKLEEAGVEHFFVPEPTQENLSKINFYTSRYFEGWDLYDKNATMVLVTDVHKAHTKVGVSKGKQAVGRLRNPPYALFHITNHMYHKQMKTLSEIKSDYRNDADLYIESHNQYIRDSKTGKFTDNPQLKFFADVNKATKEATLNLYKLDQQINESATNEVFNHIDFIKTAWEDAYFTVEVTASAHLLEGSTALKRKSRRDKLKEDIQTLRDYEKTKSNSVFHLGSETPAQRIKRQNPLAFDAFTLLSDKTLTNLDHNVKAVEKAVIEINNQHKEIKLKRLLKRTFHVKTWYFNSEITSKLQELYKKLEIMDKANKKIRTAKPSQLAEEGRFNIVGDKRLNSKGEYQYGYYIEGYQLGMKTTD